MVLDEAVYQIIVFFQRDKLKRRFAVDGYDYRLIVA